MDMQFLTTIWSWTLCRADASPHCYYDTHLCPIDKGRQFIVLMFMFLCLHKTETSTTPDKPEPGDEITGRPKIIIIANNPNAYCVAVSVLKTFVHVLIQGSSVSTAGTEGSSLSASPQKTTLGECSLCSFYPLSLNHVHNLINFVILHQWKSNTTFICISCALTMQWQ